MQERQYEWTVIGAGPAGIAVVGKLLDDGINPESICWIDPSFTAGDLGRYWRNVSSNTTVKLFHRFFEVVKAFDYELIRSQFALNACEPDETCKLGLVAEVLCDITQHLRRKVTAVIGWVQSLAQDQFVWTLTCENTTIHTENVVMATGAEPKYLPHIEGNTIPMETAMDYEKLKNVVSPGDTVGVIGASHSGVIVLQYLVEMGIKKVFNFYQSPLKFAVNMGDWILFDNTGLKGNTAKWAKANLLGELPSNLEQIYSTPASLAQYLPQCDYIVQAVGFQSRNIAIEGFHHTKYNNKTGIIAPGLFGFGIAFPEEATDPAGNTEMRVGMWKFMDYLQKVLPIWRRYSI